MISLKSSNPYRGFVPDRQSKLVVKVGKSNNKDFGMTRGLIPRKAP
jgi:hypothetical protein